MSGFISNINISSYRGIKNLQLKDLEQINILTGDNNSGKTSVLEIINTFSQPDQIKSWLDVSREDNNLLGGISIYERLNDLFNVNSEEKKVEYIIETKTEQTKVELVGKDSEAELTEEDYYDKLGYLRVQDVEDENTGDVLIDNWTIEFDCEDKISSVWGGILTKHEGNHYVITNSGYNAEIPVGETVVLGFMGTPADRADKSDVQLRNISLSCVVSQ